VAEDSAVESRLRVGVLTRPFGLNGAVRCSVETAAIPRVATPCDALAGYSAGFTRALRLVSCEPRPDALICLFEGITSPEAASGLVDQALYLEWDVVTFDDPSADARLPGYLVLDESGRELGRIDDIIRTPAHYVWSVRHGDREWLLPAVKPFVVDIQHDRRTAIVCPIPGMFEEDEDDESAGGDEGSP
jgi:16S rRNA processing protein RimM